MLTRWIPGLALVCLVAPLAPARAAEAETKGPIVIVRVRSIDALAADFRYLAGLVGGEEKAKQIEQMIKARVGEKGLEGIDTKRPFGLYANQVNSPFPVVMVPIKDEKAFLNLLKNLNVEAEKGKEGLYSVKIDFIPGEPNVYFRIANGYAYATVINASPVDKARLIDPAALKLASPNALASATLNISQVPRAIRGIITGQVKNRFKELEKQKPPRETADQEKVRLQVLHDLNAAVASVINDGHDVTIQLDVDRKGNRVGVELSLTGKSGTDLEKNIARLGEETSLFTALLTPNTAAGGRLHVTVPQNIRRALGPVIDKGMTQALEKETDETKRALAERFFKAIRPTLEAGELDVLLSLRGPTKEGLYTGLLGIKLKDAQQVEKVVKDVIDKVSPMTEKVKFKFNADKAEGVAIHQVTLAEDIDPNYRRLYGDSPAYFAFRKDALLVAIGDGSLAAIKEAIVAKPQAGPVVALDVSLVRLLPLIKQGKSPAAARFAEAAGDTFGASKDPGTIHFTVMGGKALKARLTATGGVVKLLGMAVTGYAGKAREGAE